MPRIATKLTPTARGGWFARKVIPSDVREAYARHFGDRVEERLVLKPMPVTLARAQHRDWSSEIEARIANIRAARKGEGHTLAPREARALAGEWYRWFVAREAEHWPAAVWEDYHGRMVEEIKAAAIGCGVFAGEPLDLLDTNSNIREHMRPVIADEGKIEQFLAAKRMTLESASRSMFLDSVARDFFAAIAVLARRARGDYGRDAHAETFPTLQATTGAWPSPWSLFERWVAAAKPAVSTVDRWRAVFLQLEKDHKTGPLLAEQMQAWANGLIGEERSAHTVMDVWVRSCRTVYGWAVTEKLVTGNPFIGWRIKVPKRKSNRESKAFTGAEMKLVLGEASKIIVHSKATAAKRWTPWLAAYSGARIGELMQLRGVDVIEQNGIWAVKLMPEAGTTKTGTTRIVPLHAHVIEQGFLEFVKASGAGPLFYNVPKKGDSKPDDPTNPKKPRYVKAREHVAAWVREIGVTDPEVRPNHAWRHSFKAIAFRADMSEKVIDAICGHAPATTGRAYGAPTLEDKAKDLAKFPRLP